MARKMLIDATHAEETRVVVADGQRIDDFDFESINKKQLAGNIYLAKVMRVEPSLQAAFVDYGGNRHGFLAFSEIHPDYYQISASERAALVAAQERAERSRARDEDDDAAASDSSGADAPETGGARKSSRGGSRSGDRRGARRVPRSRRGGQGSASGPKRKRTRDGELIEREFRIAGGVRVRLIDPNDVVDPDAIEREFALHDGTPVLLTRYPAGADSDDDAGADDDTSPDDDATPTTMAARSDTSDSVSSGDDTDDLPEALGGGDDEIDEPESLRIKPRHYKIQDVIKRRQILLVQVVKEERGTKGAALTTYLSLAGRYCVLMPNSGKGGGISRKITHAGDRKRLKEIAGKLEVPRGMGLIVRTAGSQQTGAEITRDYEYLMRQWEAVRDLTLQSYAPALVYEEGSLIKRTIRDLYAPDISEVLVEGEQGYREARAFMEMIMPDHCDQVIHYQDRTPLFVRHQVENQLSAMFNPTVQLKSGGYIVIGVTEALVAVDVNSGRSTRESSIEDTAVKTNLEAAEEVARQLKLRDLAGLIVIDFIDMDDRRNNAAVERKLKDKLASDRARIQVGRISSFGLLEMSRQRLRPGMVEMTTQPCAHCHGTGLVRSDDTLALTILRDVEEECVKKSFSLLTVDAPVSVANFLLNRKRERIVDIEARYGIRLVIDGNPAKISPEYELKKFKLDDAPEDLRPVQNAAVSIESALVDTPVTEEAAPEAERQEEEARAPRRDRDEDQGGKRRGRRGGKRRSERSDPLPVIDIGEDAEASEAAKPFAYAESEDGRGSGNRRSRRGGKGRRKRNDAPREMAQAAAQSMLSGADALDRALPELFTWSEIVLPEAAPAQPSDAEAETAHVNGKAPEEAHVNGKAPDEPPPAVQAEPEPVAEPAPVAEEVVGAEAEVAEAAVETPADETAPADDPVADDEEEAITSGSFAPAVVEKPKGPKRRGWWSR